MRIGEVAHATGVSIRSLRYYESTGLITSSRGANGWRDFSFDTVDRVITIQHLFAAGLCSRRITELLPCLEAPAAIRTTYLESALQTEIDRLHDQRRQIERELALLSDLRRDLAVGPDSNGTS